MPDETPLPSIDDVLSFWFGEIDDDGLSPEEFSKRWWKKDPAFDREISDRFGALIDAVVGGEREAWRTSARGSIAYVIVLDQFTRNVHRGSARMYAADDRALAAACAAVDAGLDRQLAVAERGFLYMPLMHCESREMQRRCVSVFEDFLAELEGEAAARLKGHLQAAYAHARIVERFGRFPHRNQILGRESTDDERAFLEEPGSSF